MVIAAKVTCCHGKCFSVCCGLKCPERWHDCLRQFWAALWLLCGERMCQPPHSALPRSVRSSYGIFEIYNLYSILTLFFHRSLFSGEILHLSSLFSNIFIMSISENFSIWNTSGSYVLLSLPGFRHLVSSSNTCDIWDRTPDGVFENIVETPDGALFLLEDRVGVAYFHWVRDWKKSHSEFDSLWGMFYSWLSFIPRA